MNVTVSYERYFVMKEQKCYFKKSKMNFSVTAFVAVPYFVLFARL